MSDTARAGWILPVLLSVALSAALGFGFLYLTRPNAGELGAIRVVVTDESGKVGNTVQVLVAETPLAQKDTVSPGGVFTGVVYYPAPYLTKPNLKLTSGKRKYDVTQETEMGFTWLARPLPDDFREDAKKDTSQLEKFLGDSLLVAAAKGSLKPGLAFEDFTWESKGLRAPVSALPPKTYELQGKFQTVLGQEGVVNFEIPYSAAPHVELGGSYASATVLANVLPRASNGGTRPRKEARGWKARCGGQPKGFAEEMQRSEWTSGRQPLLGGTTMQSILSQFDQLNTWRQGDKRAPHKPLLVLYALGRWQQGKTEMTFKEAEPDLAQLLREFGPPRKSDHPEQPFWRLQHDGVWVVKAPSPLPLKTGDDIPRVGALRSSDVRGGFSPEVQAALAADPKLLVHIAVQILEEHFPESLHQDILNAVGLVLEAAPKKRDPSFRLRVLKAYEYRCAVCGFDVRLGSVAVALDAAHIRWHQAGGPDIEGNGLALCVLHHKMFDLGAFTLSKDGLLLVSDQANGSAGFEETLLRHHGKPVRHAQRPDWGPVHAHLDWHAKEVFKGEARHAG